MPDTYAENPLKTVAPSPKVALAVAFDDAPAPFMARGGGTAQPMRAFVELRPSLVRFFERRIRNKSDAEDLAQEVFVRLARQETKESGGEIRQPTAFLFQIAANVLTDRYRRDSARRANEHDSLDDGDIAGEAPSAERVYAGRESLKRLVAALEELTPKCRAIFMLIRYEGLSYSEVGRRFGVGVSAVEKHVTHALQHLHWRIDPE